MPHSLPTIEEVIRIYQLQPHIEGGYFKEDFRSDITFHTEITQGKPRSLITSCYYLLGPSDRSFFHRLKADEIWHFYLGGPVNLFEINEQGALTKIILGSDISRGQHLKYHVRRNTWMGALPEKGFPYALLDCTVFPGFDFNDWEKGNADHLKTICPTAKDIIDLLT